MSNLVLPRRCVREIYNLNSNLFAILEFTLSVWPVTTCYVTSIHRTPAENSAAKARTQIHVVGPPYRAMDLRITNLGGEYQRKALNLARRINRRWVYDPQRPALNVAFARAHGSGPHIHLQVHPRTKART